MTQTELWEEENDEALNGVLSVPAEEEKPEEEK